jgi:hypothetical protein
MAWAIWLAAPLVASMLVALGIWWRARPPRAPRIAESIQGHQEYLRVLGANAVADSPPT